jgi:nitrogen regulatory protein PII-like uncharacterized protein
MTNDDDDLDFLMPHTPEEWAGFEQMERNREANAAMNRLEEDAELAKLIEAIVHEVKDRTDLEIREHIERRLRIRRGW